MIGQVPAVNETELEKTKPVQLIVVCPDLERETVAPETKLVPETEVMEAEVLLIPVVGLMAETVGAGRMIVNPLVKIPVCASGFVTTTFQVPVAAPVIGQLPVERVVELVKVNPVQEMSDWASLVNFTVAPETKLVPETEVMEAEVLFIPVVGLMAETVGAGKLIVNPFTNILF